MILNKEQNEQAAPNRQGRMGVYLSLMIALWRIVCSDAA